MTIEQYLKDALKRKKCENSSYSLRSLARDLNVSAPFLSACFNGKKKLPLKYVEPIAKRLDLDELDKKKLKTLLGSPEIEQKKVVHYHNEEKENYPILNDWYTLAILDLTTVKDFVSTPEWISEQLGIALKDTKRAIQNLMSLGLLKNLDGVLTKTNHRMRFPTSKFHPDITNYHINSLNKVIDTLKNNQFDEREYERRSVHGVMVAGNSKNIARAKEVMINALYEAAEILAQGPCDTVFHFNSILSPLSKGH